MKIAIEVYVSLFILCLTVAIGIGLISSDLAVMRARDDFYTYTNMLQDSNFADAIVDECVKNAASNGYSLGVNVFENDNNNRSAKVTLSYKYKLTPLGISQNKVIEGFIN